MSYILITFSPQIISTINGHFFEAVDYFIYLKQYFSHIKIVLPKNINFKSFMQCLKNRYLINIFKQLDIVFTGQILNAPDDIVIYTDGSPSGQFVRCKYFIGFLCSRWPAYFLSKKSWLLYDFRIYTQQFLNKNNKLFTRHIKNPTEIINTWNQFEHIDYVKKIYFRIMKSIKKETILYDYMFYTTRGWKDVSIKHLLATKYSRSKNLIISDTLRNAVVPPVENLFGKFKTYVYTGTTRHFDCSNRLIKECQYFNKSVIFDIDYYDKALDVRWKDPLKSIDLSYDTKLIDMLRSMGAT